MIKTKKWMSGILAVLLCCMMLPIVPALAAELTSFPVISEFSGDLVADEKTEYITLLSQDPVTKMITATIQIKHGGDAGSPNLLLDGIGIQLSFSDKVAPFDYDTGTIFTGKTLSRSEFEKYSKALMSTFKDFGSMIVQNDESGRFISTKLSCSRVEDRLIILPGQTVSVAELYFMPVNGTDTLRSGMFKYEYRLQDFLRCAAWIALGTYSMQYTGLNTTNIQNYIVSPNSFKIRTADQLAEIQAIKTAENLTSTDGKTRVGDIIKYTIKVSNVGKDGSVLVNTELYDTINQYVDFIVESVTTFVPYTWSYNLTTREFIAHLGDIAKGQEKTVTFIVRVKDNAFGCDITNFVTVNGRDGNDSDADLFTEIFKENTNIRKVERDISRTPTVNPITEGDSQITGTGEPNADVTVTLKDGSQHSAKVNSDRTWTVPLSVDKRPGAGDEIRVVQVEFDREPSNAVTVTVQQKPTVLVTFDKIHDSANLGGDPTKTVTVGEQYGTLPTPSMDGAIFAGWWTQPCDGKQINQFVLVDAADCEFDETKGYTITLYAQWEPYVVPYLPGDINRDGDVNILDLSILLANFGKSGAAITDLLADINEDGDVNILDLSILLSNFGKRLAT